MRYQETTTLLGSDTSKTSMLIVFITYFFFGGLGDENVNDEVELSMPPPTNVNVMFKFNKKYCTWVSFDLLRLLCTSSLGIIYLVYMQKFLKN